MIEASFLLYTIYRSTQVRAVNKPFDWASAVGAIYFLALMTEKSLELASEGGVGLGERAPGKPNKVALYLSSGSCMCCITKGNAMN